MPFVRAPHPSMYRALINPKVYEEPLLHTPASSNMLAPQLGEQRVAPAVLLA